VKGKYFQSITSIGPKLTTSTEIGVDSFKIGSFYEFEKNTFSDPEVFEFFFMIS
jgi:hypothetical protein